MPLSQKFSSNTNCVHGGCLGCRLMSKPPQVFSHGLMTIGEHFLPCIVTRDETWVHNYEPESKTTSCQNSGTLLLQPKRTSSLSPLQKGAIDTLFWDMNGPIAEHCQKEGRTVNSARYSAAMEGKLKPAIWSCHRGLLSKGIVIHENACHHTAAATVSAI